MIRPLAAVLLAMGFASAGPAALGQTNFALPSGNVACFYTPAGGTRHHRSADGTAELSCDRAKPSYVRVTMTERSPVVINANVSDPSCCSADEALSYGETWREGPFSCESKQTGLTCRRADGRGFSVSRAGVSKF